MTIKNTALCLWTILFLLTIEAKSEILRWPQLCLNGNLVVKNSSLQNVRVWVQKFSGAKRTENEFSIRPFSQGSIFIQAENLNERYSLMHFADPQKVSAEFFCEKSRLSTAAQSFEGGISTFLHSDLPENKLWLQNLFSAQNRVHIDFMNAADEMVFSDTVELKSFEQKNYKAAFLEGTWHHVRVWGESRFTVFNLGSKGVEAAKKVQPQVTNVDFSAAYFVVGPREGEGDTFIARISDPNMIAYARQLVLHPEYEKMLFAKIEKGHQGFNRNWSKTEKSFWSWSVTVVTNFAEIGSTACNGLPQLVEDDVDLWIQNPGRICFWNYRVKKELSPSQVASGQL